MQCRRKGWTCMSCCRTVVAILVLLCLCCSVPAVNAAAFRPSSNGLFEEQTYPDGIVIDFSSNDPQQYSFVSCRIPSIAIMGTSAANVEKVFRLDNPIGLDYFSIADGTLSNRNAMPDGVMSVIELSHVNLVNMSAASFGRDVLKSTRHGVFAMSHSRLFNTEKLESEYNAFENLAELATNTTVNIMNTTITVVSQLSPTTPPSNIPEPSATSLPTPSPNAPTGGHSSIATYFKNTLSKSTSSTFDARSIHFFGTTNSLGSLGSHASFMSSSFININDGDDNTELLKDSFYASQHNIISVRYSTFQGKRALHGLARMSVNITLRSNSLKFGGEETLVDCCRQCEGGALDMTLGGMASANRSGTNFLKDAMEVQVKLDVSNAADTGFSYTLHNFTQRVGDSLSLSLHGSGAVYHGAEYALFSYTLSNCSNLNASINAPESYNGLSYLGAGGGNNHFSLHGSIEGNAMQHFGSWSTNSTFVFHLENVKYAFPDMLTEAADCNFTVANFLVSHESFLNFGYKSRGVRATFTNVSFKGTRVLENIGSYANGFVLHIETSVVSSLLGGFKKALFGAKDSDARFIQVYFTNSHDIESQATGNFENFAAQSIQNRVVLQDSVFTATNLTFFKALAGAEDFTFNMTNSEFTNDAIDDFLFFAANASQQQGHNRVIISSCSFNGSSTFSSIGAGATAVGVLVEATNQFGNGSSWNFNNSLSKAGPQAGMTIHLSVDGEYGDSFNFLGTACVGCNISLHGTETTKLSGNNSFSNIGRASASSSIVVLDVQIDTSELSEHLLANLCAEASDCNLTIRRTSVWGCSQDGAFTNAGAGATNGSAINVDTLTIGANADGTRRAILNHLLMGAQDSEARVENVDLKGASAADTLLFQAGFDSQRCHVSISNAFGSSPATTITVGTEALCGSSGGNLYLSNCDSSVLLRKALSNASNGRITVARTQQSAANASLLREAAWNADNVTLLVEDVRTAGYILQGSIKNSQDIFLTVTNIHAAATILEASIENVTNGTVAIAAIHSANTELISKAIVGSFGVSVEISNVIKIGNGSLTESFLGTVNCTLRVQNVVADSGVVIGTTLFQRSKAANAVYFLSSDFTQADPRSFSDLLRAALGHSKLKINSSRMPLNGLGMDSVAAIFVDISNNSIITECARCLKGSTNATVIAKDSELVDSTDLGSFSMGLVVALTTSSIRTDGAMANFMSNATHGTLTVSESTIGSSAPAMIANTFTSAFAGAVSCHATFINCHFDGAGEFCRECFSHSVGSRLNLTDSEGKNTAVVAPNFATFANEFEGSFTSVSNLDGDSLFRGGFMCISCLVSMEDSTHFSGRTGQMLLTSSRSSRIVLRNLDDLESGTFYKLLRRARDATSSVAYITNVAGATTLADFGDESIDSSLCLRAATIHHNDKRAMVDSIGVDATNPHIMCLTRTETISPSTTPSPSLTISASKPLVPTASSTVTPTSSSRLSVSEAITTTASEEGTYTKEPTQTETCREPFVSSATPSTVDILHVVDGYTNISIRIEPAKSFNHINFNLSWGGDGSRQPVLRGYAIMDDYSRLELEVAAPPDTPLREDAEIIVIIGRDSFGCPPDEDLEVRVHVEGLPTTIDVQVKKSIQVAATATGAIAGILSNPTLALQQNRLTALFMLSSCRFEHSEELDSSNNPAGWKFGSNAGRYYRGAIVGNITITLSCGLGLLLVGCVLHLFVSNKRKTIWSSVALVHFPGLGIVPYTVVAQGTMMSSVAIMLHGTDQTDMLLGATGIGFGLAVMALCTIATTRYFNTACIERDRVERKTESAKSALRRLTTMFYTHYKWVDNGSGFRPHFQHLFNDFRPKRQWYLGVEICLTLIIGGLEGVRPNSSAGCTVVLACMGLACVALFLLMVILHPFAAKYNIYHALIANGCAVVSAGCLVAAQMGSTETPVALSEYSTLIAMTAGMLKMAVDVLFLVLWMKTRSGHLLERFNQTFRSNTTGLTEDDLKAMMVLDVPDNDQPEVAEELPEVLPEVEAEIDLDFDLTDDSKKNKAIDDELDTWLLGGPADVDPFAQDDPLDNAFLEEKERKAEEIRKGLAKGSFDDDGSNVP